MTKGSTSTLRDLERIVGFWSAWARQEEAGHCDSIGGAQSRRVFEQWILADMPTDADSFIREDDARQAELAAKVR